MKSNTGPRALESFPTEQRLLVEMSTGHQGQLSARAPMQKVAARGGFVDGPVDSVGRGGSGSLQPRSSGGAAAAAADSGGDFEGSAAARPEDRRGAPGP